jgi:hypothetical protein
MRADMVDGFPFGSMVMFSELLVALFSGGRMFETGSVQPSLQ